MSACLSGPLEVKAGSRVGFLVLFFHTEATKHCGLMRLSRQAVETAHKGHAATCRLCQCGRPALMFHLSFRVTCVRVSSTGCHAPTSVQNALTHMDSHGRARFSASNWPSLLQNAQLAYSSISCSCSSM